MAQMFNAENRIGADLHVVRDSPGPPPPPPRIRVSGAKPARLPLDWDAIERTFRLGQYSVRKIGKRFGVSHSAISRWADKYGWTQDKSAEVRARVRARLLLPAPDAPDAPRTTPGAHQNAPGGTPNEAEIEAAVQERLI